MKRILSIPIIIFSKILTFVLKKTNKGSGTALPGLIVDKYFPFVFGVLINQIPNKIVITGTNGKTTTQTVLRNIFKLGNVKVLTNSAGANLTRGIVSELLKQSTLFGKINFEYAIFEVEEATMPKIINKINPNLIAVTNLYRDQLDAYGEIDITERYIHQAIEKCPNAFVILNGDDPRVSKLTTDLPNTTHYVSLPPQFAQELPYEGIETKPTEDENVLTASQIELSLDLVSSFSITGSNQNVKIEINDCKVASPGFFHIYNVLIATHIALLAGIDTKTIKEGINSFKPAFGRGEKIIKTGSNKNVNYRLLLIKNPAGFSLNLKLLQNIPNLNLMILINDNTADGKDVSWLWDSKVEELNNANLKTLYLGGIRAHDIHTRIKYALTKTIDIEKYIDIKACIEESFKKAENNQTIFVLPTYTAMLEFRKLLGKNLE